MAVKALSPHHWTTREIPTTTETYNNFYSWLKYGNSLATLKKNNLLTFFLIVDRCIVTEIF